MNICESLGVNGPSALVARKNTMHSFIQLIRFCMDSGCSFSGDLCEEPAYFEALIQRVHAGYRTKDVFISMIGLWRMDKL